MRLPLVFALCMCCVFASATIVCALYTMCIDVLCMDTHVCALMCCVWIHMYMHCV